MSPYLQSFGSLELHVSLSESCSENLYLNWSLIPVAMKLVFKIHTLPLFLPFGSKALFIQVLALRAPMLYIAVPGCTNTGVENLR